MNSEELELFSFVITSGRNSDNCNIILIEIYKEGSNMPLHERGKVVLYKSSLQKMYSLLNVFVVLCKKCTVFSMCL